MAKRRRRQPGAPATVESVAALAGLSEPSLCAALQRRGAITPTLLQDLQGRWQPMAEARTMLTFTGRSVTSVVPVAMRRGRISGSALKALKEAFEGVASWGRRQERPGGRIYQDVHFRVRSSVRAAQTNGGNWGKLAHPAVADFVRKFLRANPALVAGLRRYAASRPTHRHKGEEVSIFENPDDVADNLFAYAAMYRCTGGASDMWHCDGGPSMIFMSVSVEGGRILQVEDAVGNLRSLELHEGDVYLSSPSCFWHSVRPLSSKTSKTLILRSSILTRRYSGGRGGYKQSDKGTTGYPMETKAAFQEFASVAFNVLSRGPVDFSFDMKSVPP